MEMISNEEKITQAVLVSVDTGDYDAEASLAELKELVKVRVQNLYLQSRKSKAPRNRHLCGHRQIAGNCGYLQTTGNRLARV